MEIQPWLADMIIPCLSDLPSTGGGAFNIPNLPECVMKMTVLLDEKAFFVEANMPHVSANRELAKRFADFWLLHN